MQNNDCLYINHKQVTKFPHITYNWTHDWALTFLLSQSFKRLQYKRDQKPFVLYNFWFHRRNANGANFDPKNNFKLALYYSYTYCWKISKDYITNKSITSYLLILYRIEYALHFAFVPRLRTRCKNYTVLESSIYVNSKHLDICSPGIAKRKTCSITTYQSTSFNFLIFLNLLYRCFRISGLNCAVHTNYYDWISVTLFVCKQFIRSVHLNKNIIVFLTSYMYLFLLNTVLYVCS